MRSIIHSVLVFLFVFNSTAVFGADATLADQKAVMNMSKKELAQAVQKMSKPELEAALADARAQLEMSREDLHAAKIQDDGRVVVKIRKAGLYGYGGTAALFLFGLFVSSKFKGPGDGDPIIPIGILCLYGATLSTVILVGGEIAVVLSPSQVSHIEHRISKIEGKIDTIRSKLNP